MSTHYLNPAEAARRLGVSAKALRLYEQRGLLKPLRSQAGWRVYGPEEMALAAEVAALRRLGLSLIQTERVLAGERADLDAALAAHQSALESEGRRIADLAAKVRAARAELAEGGAPSIATLSGLEEQAPAVRFELPWPWGGELFELPDCGPLTFIVGPLGSGKTRLAMALADALEGAQFLGLDRLEDIEAARRQCEGSPALQALVDADLDWLTGEGATISDALLALLAGLHSSSATAIVVDMVEGGLDEPTQSALIARLRTRGAEMRPLFLMTRSSAILDLEAAGPTERIIYCPANHAAPLCVVPLRGAPGYEAVETCLATPEVRARTHGLRVVRGGT